MVCVNISDKSRNCLQFFYNSKIYNSCWQENNPLALSKSAPTQWYERNAHDFYKIAAVENSFLQFQHIYVPTWALIVEHVCVGCTIGLKETLSLQ